MILKISLKIEKLLGIILCQQLDSFHPVLQVLILITDGRSENERNTVRMANVAKGRGITIFTIGVTPQVDKVWVIILQVYLPLAKGGRGITILTIGVTPPLDQIQIILPIIC